MGCATASLGLILSGVRIKDGLEEYRASKKIGDAEGLHRAESQIASGALLSHASALLISQKAILLAGTAQTAAVGVGLAGHSFFGAGMALAIGMAGWGIYRSAKFRWQLDKLANDPSCTEAERMQNTLVYLKELIVPSSQEVLIIKKKLEKENPLKSHYWIERELNRQVSGRIETNLKYLKRRTSSRSLKLLLDPAKGIGPILSKLDQTATRGEGAQEARALIEELQKDNLRKIGLFTVSLLIAAISLAAVILMSAFSFGTLPIILYIVATVLSLCIVAHRQLGKAPESEQTDLPAPVGGARV
jgi:hypothetical protein